MTEPNFIILYVADPAASARFYTTLLGKAALEVSPTFALFALESGLMLGLWAKYSVQPAPLTAGGSSEIAFSVSSLEIVDRLFADWSKQGLCIAQAPTAMDFGHTFVGLDPDGHRLRVFAPAVA